MDSSRNNQTIPNNEEQTYLFAVQLASGSVLPAVLKSVIELDLLEILARAGEVEFLSSKDIVAQIPTRNPEAAVMLDRILWFLASYSVLKCRVRVLPEDGAEERLYAAGPVCKYLTKNKDGVSMAGVLMMNQDKVITDKWDFLKEAVLEGGIPFNIAHGMTLFEYSNTDPRFSHVFNKALSHESTIIMEKILETYTGFEGLGSLVDIGGGVGATLNKIISKYPFIKGINFDLPHVINNAPIFQGVEHVAGDMFASVPKGDAIFMKSICHDWTDADCLKLLKNCYNALPENGKVIIVERLLSVYPDTSTRTKNACYADVLMLAATPGGKERTEKEFEALGKRAGFAGFRVVCPAYDFNVIEFLKNV